MPLSLERPQNFALTYDIYHTLTDLSPSPWQASFIPPFRL